MPNRKLKCKWCKGFYPRELYIKSRITNAGKFHSDECMLKFALDKRNQANAKKKIHKEKKKSVKPLKHWRDLTQKAFNKMRVLQELKWFKDRGLEPECISCGKIEMDWCCGHFKTRGASSNLAFDEKNTYLQCNRYCNCGLSGNIEGNKTTRGYKKGLEYRFGEKKAKEIIEYCENSNEIVKHTREELENMRKFYNAESRRLTKEIG